MNYEVLARVGRDLSISQATRYKTFLGNIIFNFYHTYINPYTPCATYQLFQSMNQDRHNFHSIIYIYVFKRSSICLYRFLDLTAAPILINFSIGIFLILRKEIQAIFYRDKQHTRGRSHEQKLV